MIVVGASRACLQRHGVCTPSTCTDAGVAWPSEELGLSQAMCGGMCQAHMFLTQLWEVHGNKRFRRSSYSQLTTCEHYPWSGSENGTLFDERNLWINRLRNSQLCSPAHFSSSPTHEGKCEDTLCTSHVGYRVLNPQRRPELSSVFSCWHGAAFPYFCCCRCLNKNRPIVYLVFQASCGNVVTVILPQYHAIPVVSVMIGKIFLQKKLIFEVR